MFDIRFTNTTITDAGERQTANEDDYGSIANSTFTLSVVTALVILGAVAQKIASAIWSEVRPLMPDLEPVTDFLNKPRGRTTGEPIEPGGAVEPGGARMSPEERALLDRTASKPSEDLSPSELKAERDIADRIDPEPIDEPPFTTQRELPNGHEIKETPNGEFVERCSGRCAIFDSDGNLVENKAVEDPFTEDPGAAQEAKGVAHDIGVQQGREAAAAEGLQPAPDWVNPLEDRGPYGQGFDDVLLDANGNEVIGEYKGGQAELAPGQMERPWVQRVINRMRQAGHAQWADRLQAALDAGRLRGVAYSTPIDPVTGVPGPTRVIGRWTY